MWTIPADLSTPYNFSPLWWSSLSLLLGNDFMYISTLTASVSIVLKGLQTPFEYITDNLSMVGTWMQHTHKHRHFLLPVWLCGYLGQRSKVNTGRDNKNRCFSATLLIIYPSLHRSVGPLTLLTHLLHFFPPLPSLMSDERTLCLQLLLEQTCEHLLR